MKILELTEYRGDGNFYPIVIVVMSNFAAFEAELQTPGPHIINETKAMGKGSFLVGAVPGKNLTVKETVQEIAAMLKAEVGYPSEGLH